MRGLGLQAKDMAALKVKHVLGVDGALLEEINLESALFQSQKGDSFYPNTLQKLFSSTIPEMRDCKAYGVIRAVERSRRL